jgi:hypothetical protein
MDFLFLLFCASLFMIGALLYFIFFERVRDDVGALRIAVLGNGGPQSFCARRPPSFVSSSTSDRNFLA